MVPVTKLYFVRHGESQANILHEFSNTGWKHGLTEKGFEQVKILATKFHGQRIARIYTSPLRRAVESTAILSDTCGVAYAISDALREFDTGFAEGKSDPESWAIWEKVMQDWMLPGSWDERMPGGESFNDLRLRFLPFIDRLVTGSSHHPGDFILVGHGGLFFNMLPLVMGNINRQEINLYGFPNTGYVIGEVRPEGLTCLEWCGARFQ
jgi:broad specificity phosphatase PhoE